MLSEGDEEVWCSWYESGNWL